MTPSQDEVIDPRVSDAFQGKLRRVDDHILKDRSGLRAIMGRLAVAKVLGTLRHEAAWLLGAATFLLVANRVLWVSHGNISTALEIISTASKSTILFGTLIQVLPFIAIALYATILTMLANRMAARVRIRSFHRFAQVPLPFSFLFDAANSWLLVLLPMSLVLMVVFIPWWAVDLYAAFTVFIFCFETITLVIWHRKMRTIFASESGSDEEDVAIAAFDKIFDLGASAFIVQIFVVVILMLFSTATWLPDTNIRLTSGQTIVGYVLSDNAQKSSILIDQSRQVITIGNQSIDAEQICNVPGSSETMANKLGLISLPTEPWCKSTSPRKPLNQKSNR